MVSDFRRSFRSRKANMIPTAKAPKPMASGSNAGRYSCMALRLYTSNSFKSYACDQQEGTDSDCNPKPLAGEGFTLRQNPI
jgi:hypothetical protein